MINKINHFYGVFAKNRLTSLVTLINQIKDKNELEKLAYINDYFNRTPYDSDMNIWGVKDYWATRLEFIGKDRGDCEDYVIAKYFTLKELGISTDKMYFTYVKAVKYNVAHMVLTYYPTPDAMPLILDNYNQNIFPANKRKDLIFVFSFSGEDLFKAKQVKIGKIAPAVTKQTKPWDELEITQ